MKFFANILKTSKRAEAAGQIPSQQTRRTCSNSCRSLREHPRVASHALRAIHQRGTEDVFSLSHGHRLIQVDKHIWGKNRKTAGDSSGFRVAVSQTAHVGGGGNSLDGEEVKIADPLSKIGDFWWGRTDSNHRSETQQIYSLSPLATRELPHMRLCLEDWVIIAWIWDLSRGKMK